LGAGSPHLELRHDGAVGGVEELRECEWLWRLAALEERRAALIEIPRHLRVQLRAPFRHGGGAAWGKPRKKRHKISQLDGHTWWANCVGERERLKRITKRWVHARPAKQQDDEEERGGREEPYGSERRSGASGPARGPRGHPGKELDGGVVRVSKFVMKFDEMRRIVPSEF
jgi:hypothetical protein